ncbi:hypothetical protein [Rothia sp. ZJ1223]|uniref:hypothetical protein n=1 Tax=Rothia sp. ZJ1223 TaxID=2811098 RepID=UPI00195ADCBB|nr:hypothetical protein [Rothia sp. ZJ1223]MBM7050797.1 hypothetical protein [Rothia sp. ZJ1223]
MFRKLVPWLAVLDIALYLSIFVVPYDIVRPWLGEAETYPGLMLIFVVPLISLLGIITASITRRYGYLWLFIPLAFAFLWTWWLGSIIEGIGVAV